MGEKITQDKSAVIDAFVVQERTQLQSVKEPRRWRDQMGHEPDSQLNSLPGNFGFR